ncbi:MAG: type VII toxin-antitoxin system HepT family RNase toxin [Acidobacteriota bacterium]
MTIDRDVIESRLASLTQYLRELETIQGLSFQEYLSDFKNRRTVERLLQLIIETACDINNHIVLKTNHKPPSDHHRSFTRLGELGILPQSLCRDLARSVGLRNRLVHEYEIVNDEIVFNTIPTALEQYRSYILIIGEYLKSEEACSC